MSDSSVVNKQQHVSNQVDWDSWNKYIDSRIELYNSRCAGDDTLPSALHEALGQVLAEERRQWRRERALIESEAKAVISDLRATISELQNEIRKTASEVKPGAPGPIGPPGIAGRDGRDGKLPIARKYEPSAVYYQGDVVTHDGSLYQATRDTGRAVSHADWICLARAGRDGRDGTTPEIRGTYDYKERYAKLDIVASDGAAFIAKRDNPGICPGEGWQLMSQQGRRGKPGKDGERGLRGEKGEKGPPAVVPQLINSRISENYEIVLAFSDSSKEVIPLRDAFERYHNESGRGE